MGGFVQYPLPQHACHLKQSTHIGVKPPHIGATDQPLPDATAGHAVFSKWLHLFKCMLFNFRQPNLEEYPATVSTLNFEHGILDADSFVLFRRRVRGRTLNTHQVRVDIGVSCDRQCAAPSFAHAVQSAVEVMTDGGLSTPTVVRYGVRFATGQVTGFVVLYSAHVLVSWFSTLCHSIVYMHKPDRANGDPEDSPYLLMPDNLGIDTVWNSEEINTCLRR